jgi:2-methylisocitrate lyase-like PEP mutase family enzyme
MADNPMDHARAQRQKFRALLRRDKLTVMPGGFSPLYARMAQEAGFESFFLAGSQLSNVLYGVPDNGIIGMRDLVDHARHMAARTDIPIFVDADTGFGNAVNVHYAVEEIIRAGVAALQIEDQEAPKKSGTAAGRRLIPMAEAVGKIRAAVAARDGTDPEFAICARCDALGAEGGGFEDALARSVAYVKEGGADFVWLNSVETRDQVRRACREIPAPVLLIWGGDGPAPSPAEYEAMGVRIALYPAFTSSYAVQVVWQLLNDFHERGPIALAERQAELRKSKWGLVEQSRLAGSDKIQELERRFLTADAQRDYAGTWGHKIGFEKDEPPKP